MKKYPKIKYPSDVPEVYEDGVIIILEKLDGGNFRFGLQDGQLLFGSRNVVYRDMDEIPNMFRPVADYIVENIDLNVLQGYEGLWFYGEAMVPHTLSYDRDKTPLFVGFDVYDPDKDSFLGWGGMKFMFWRLGFKTAPVVDIIHSSHLDDYELEVPVSEYREQREDAEREINQRGLAEGVVVRNEMNGARTKVVHPEFKEQNKETFGGNEEPKTDAEKFVAEYVTEARIRKMIFRLMEDGLYERVRMEMMKDLPKRVLEDVTEEHAWEIFMSDYDLDTDTRGAIRSITSGKCAGVLREECQKL